MPARVEWSGTAWLNGIGLNGIGREGILAGGSCDITLDDEGRKPLGGGGSETIRGGGK